MHRKRLVATVAAAPLLLFAQAAWAETTVTTAVTTPVQTSTTNDDVRVTSTGSIKPTVAGPALKMDSNDNITNEGAISTTGVNDSVGMQAAGGLTGNVTNKGSIAIVEDYTPVDTDPDGDGPLTGDGNLDGPFAQGSGRYGIRVTGGVGPLTGSVLGDTGSSINVEGNNSTGISIESGLTGSLTNKGSISVLGDHDYGIHTTGAIGGAVTLDGSTTAQGDGSVAVAIDSNVGGAMVIQGAMTATGFRYTTRPALAADRAKLGADDLLTGGPAVRIGGDVAGGILIDVRPADLNPDNGDEDNDGTPDAQEGNGAITSYGSSPALLIGSTANTVTIGTVGTGDNAYGLISKGAITADGVFDGFNTVGLQIGAGPAFATTVTGGVRNDGTINTRAYLANTTGVLITDGATLGGAGVFWNKGQIVSQLLTKSTLLLLEPHQTATGILLQAGAQADTIRNTGTITVGVFGENSDAIAIQDLSGSLTTIENTGKIQAIITPTDDEFDVDDADIDPSNEVINGHKVAIDVSAATHAVTITQSGVNDGDDGADGIADADADADGVDDADEPVIAGDVKFGSGADALNLANGSMTGDVYFGAGQDAFNITGGASFLGHVNDSDGLLDINLANGRLAVADTENVNATSLTVGADGALLVTIDAPTDAVTKFVVDTADFATGSQLGVRVNGLLEFDNITDTKSYVVVQANTLTAGAIDDTLLGFSPFIYKVGIDANETTDALSLTVRRRTAAEAGLNASETAAFDAFYTALGEDAGIRDAILARATRTDFLKLYDQLLPDQEEGLFSALDYANLSIAKATATRPDPHQRYGPDSFWMQELNLQVKRDGGDTLGSETKGFGFVGGYESMDEKGGALGATLAYVSAEEKDDAAQVGEQTTASLVELGAYWRRAAGAWLFSVRGGAGYGFFDGTRRFIAPAEQTIRQANATWNGYTLGASASAAYETRFGRYYLRPTLSVDYFYLSEGGRDESGGGDLFDQHVDGRTSSRLSADAEVVFGADYGRDIWWRPEVKVGFRQVLSGQVGDTTARFGTGNPFTLAAMDSNNGAAVIGFALKAGTPMSYLALEAEMERFKNEQRYNAKLSGRVMF